MADDDVKIKVSLDGADGVEKGLNGVGDGASKADSKLGGMVSGGLKGAGVALGGFALAAGAAGAALAVGVTKAYSDYQQNVGGIEKLFGTSADTMQKYAQGAYKTAGLSANDYMSQATSFSAALIHGLGGDQAAAAEKANQAITDMSDNANVFGSNIGDIQNAYQGFAKQNFTMLDNLKLGYGGTGAEMARLVNDSGVMGDSFTATAANINSVSYDKIIDAIHKVQDNMGITGDTAREASQTVAGSVASMQGAYQNFLAGLGDPNQDIGALAKNLVDSFQTVVKNISPVITQIGTSISTLGPELGTMIQTVIGTLASVLPAILNTGVALVTGLIQGIISAAPGIVTALVPAITGLVTSVFTLAPQLITAGIGAVTALVSGIASAAPTLVPAIMGGIQLMILALATALPQLITAAESLVTALATGLLTELPNLIPVIVSGILSMVTAILGMLPVLLTAGLQIIMGLVQGVLNALPVLVAALPAIITALVTFLVAAIPQIITAGIQLLTAIITALPTIIAAVVKAIPLIVAALATTTTSPASINAMVQAGIALLVAMVKAQPQITAAIVRVIPSIISSLVSSIGAGHGSMSSAGQALLVAIVLHVASAITAATSAVKSIVTAATGAVATGVSGMASAGLNLVKGIGSGITSGTSWLLGVIGSFAKTITSGVKSFFGIHSPSKLWADEVGAMLPAGLGVGVTLNQGTALGPIQDLNKQIMAEAASLNTSVAFQSTQTLVPMQATAQQAMPTTIQATLDPSLISNAITESFAARGSGTEQAAVSLTKESISTLASAIVDSVRVQSRQGGVVIG